MQKYVLLILLLFTFPSSIYAKEKVTFDECVDGDTAKVIYNNEQITLRFLAVDTPESVHPTKEVELYGKEASNYTCDTLKKANSIEIEFDNNSDKQDKYNRFLVWVFVDNELLQSKLVKEGYAKVAYLYGDYKYTSELQSLQSQAQKSQLRIWSDYEKSDDIIYYILLTLLVIIMLCNKKFRKKYFKKLVKQNIK